MHHRRKGEEPCQPCWVAARAYWAERKRSKASGVATATVDCRTCGASFTRAGRAGKPPIYCSAACHKKRHASRPQAIVCQGCGAITPCPDNRGTLPKWCAPCRKRNIRQSPCRACGRIFTTTTVALYCSDQCKPAPKPLGPPRLPKQLTLPLFIDQRSNLRQAHERGDQAGVIEEHTGCWIWQHQSKGGYPQVRFAGRTLQVHRLSLEAKHGAPLGSQAAHHTCGVSMCVNPEHL